MERMFEKASRLAVTYETANGLLSVSDLWTLPLTSQSKGRANLDAIAIDLNKKVKASGESESFVTDTVKVDEVLVLKFEIVKYIIGVLKEERAVALEKAKRKEAKQLLVQLRAQKEGEAMGALSLEEIDARLAELGD
jgi:hypothetical protein